jgi:hypothetical protein
VSRIYGPSEAIYLIPILRFHFLGFVFIIIFFTRIQGHTTSTG